MAIDTGTDEVLARIDEGVGVITLNRPGRRNALSPDMHRAVPRLLDLFISSSEVGCIMITGAGKAFCAGGDVRGSGSANPRSRSKREPRRKDATGGGHDRRSSLAADQGYLLARSTRMVEVLHGSPKITLAALPGPAVGAGMSIALAADLRIAAESATLASGWGRLGFSGDFGGPWFLARLVGPSRALELLMDEKPTDAASAWRLGLFNRVVPDGQLAAAAFAWAAEIAERPQLASAFFKANVHQAAHLPLAEAISLESERMARLVLTDDHREAVDQWFEEAAAKREGHLGEDPQR